MINKIKNTVAAVAVLALSTQNAFAATAALQNNVNWDRNEGEEAIPAITVRAQSDTEITAENDIRITIPNSLKVTYKIDHQDITFTGSAQNKVGSEFVYSENGTMLTIDVTEDFELNEDLVISNIIMRVYEFGNSRQSLEIDLTNDGTTDVFVGGHIRIDENSSRKDNLAPYPVSNINIVVNEDNHLLTWDLPIDLDLNRVEIDLEDSGETFNAALTTSYTDNDMNSQYIFRANDGTNYSKDITVFAADFVEQEEEPEEEPEEVFCTEEYAPVCGVDGETYSNTCYAEEINGVEVDYEGECGSDDDVSEPASFLLEDVNGHWAESYIKDAVNSDIAEGYNGTEFRPNNNLNRAEASAFVLRSINNYDSGIAEISPIEGATEDDEPFSDVQVGDWFFDAVYTLNQQGIVNGNPDGSFAPGRAVNRAEFIKMAMEAAYDAGIYQQNASFSADFADVSSDDWFYSYVAHAQAEGVIEGKSCGSEKCFDPTGLITRAEAIKILAIFL